MYRRTENMRYYKHLYLTEGLEKKKEKIMPTCQLLGGDMRCNLYLQANNIIR